MSNFMFLFRGGAVPDASPEKMQAHMQKWMSWIQQLREQGKYIAGEPLQSGGKVVSSRRKTITDGPFAEGKEIVAQAKRILSKMDDPFLRAPWSLCVSSCSQARTLVRIASLFTIAATTAKRIAACPMT